MTGLLAPEFGNLTYLQSLRLDGHHFQGTVPLQLGSLTHLQILNLSSNQLSGSLPATLGQLQSEFGVWLDHNRLTGSIPEVCNVTVTSAVHLDHNSGLFGDVPHCLRGRLGLGQGRGLEGTGLSLHSSTQDDRPVLNDQASADGIGCI
ncbi:hypothetical protein ABBQ32_009961 [Trebouxia sp. C0010 RCD-2024]